MNDSAVNLAMIGRLVRSRWHVLLALAVLGGLLGFEASQVLSPGFESSSKVLLQGERDKTSVPGEIQIATSSVVLDRTAEALGGGETGRDLQGRVTASVLDGNVVQISATAATPQQAQLLADRATREYVAFSSQIVSDAAQEVADASQRSRDALQKHLDEANARVAALQASPVLGSNGADGIQARADLQQAQSAAQQATQELDAADRKRDTTELENAKTQSGMRVIEPAGLPDGPASPTQLELIVGGILLLPLIGIFVHLLGYRTDQRLRSGQLIGAALGAPVLSDVEVDARLKNGRFSWLRDDRRWTLADASSSEDERGRASRYQRVLSRVGTGSGPQRLSVLVPRDDANGQAAVADMVVAVGSSGRTSVLITDDSLRELIRVRAGSELGDRLVLDEVADDTAVVVLRVTVIDAARPVVPDEPVNTAIVLVTAVASRTPFELSAISGACIDAGQRLAGVVVAVPRLDGHGRKGDPVAANLDDAGLTGNLL